jgi:transcriptional regulator with XRE-family HTH domain
MTFGQTVAAERRRRGLSQKDLAALVVKEDGTPISPQYLNDIERDRRNPPSDFLIEKIAQVLELPVEHLFFLAGQFPPQDRDGRWPKEDVQRAFVAFRRELKGETPR